LVASLITLSKSEARSISEEFEFGGAALVHLLDEERGVQRHRRLADDGFQQLQIISSERLAATLVQALGDADHLALGRPYR